ncbi:MAG TPA: NAD(P)/FAD-dependent oxidoreductase [Thermodesulfobacteriota bacterium]
MNVSVETVVVGAGPAGLGVAVGLAARGREALVVDRARFPRDKICGDFMGPGAAAALGRLGLLADLPAGVARPLSGMRLTAARAPGTVVVGRYDAARQGLAARRRDLDAALLVASRARGVRVLEGVRVLDLLRDRRGAAAGVLAEGPGREPLEIRARLVVGADGRHSVVARRLGLARPAPPGFRRFAVRAFFADPLAGASQAPAFGEMHLGEGGLYGGLSALPGGLASVCLVTDHARLPRGREALASWYDAQVAAFPALARRLAGGRRVSGVEALGPLAVGAAGVVADGALLVGDAAGFFDPLTGEGMLTALRGAELAVEAADRALEAGDVRAAALGGYVRARRAEFAPRLRLDRALQMVVPRPALAAWLARCLASRPPAADRLVRLSGGDLPVRTALGGAVLVGLAGVLPAEGRAADRTPTRIDVET